MTIYRVWCVFNPTYKRADGGRAAGTRMGTYTPARPVQRHRGAWVVNDVHPANSPVSRQVIRGVITLDVGILSFTPRRVGTRVSPIKLLKEYQAQRNA